ncbi:6684_t:CDS:2, partial [Cetraspora pellucida]
DLSLEYSSCVAYKIPIMIITNEWNEDRNDILNKIKTVVGEEFLFDAIDDEASGFNKILKDCMFKFSGFKEIYNINGLIHSNDQIESMIEYATRLFSFKIPMKVIHDRQKQIEGLSIEGIKSFLSLFYNELINTPIDYSG